MKLKTLFLFFITAFVIGAVVIFSAAQELCEVLAREAFETVDDNCAGVDASSACYGFNDLAATFNAALEGNPFARPSDLVQIIELHTIHTSAYDEEEEEWGIGYFQIPVENEDPIVLMMAGDVIVENAVDAASADALNPLQNFNFTTGGSADCRQTPNAVFIQSPRELPVDLTINSTPIRIGSTVVIGTERDENGEELMWFSVVEGKLTVYPDSPQEQVIPEGFYSTVLLSDEFGNGLDGEDAIDEELVPVLNRVTGEPIMGPGGEPFYRRIPVTEFTTPEVITPDGEDFKGWGIYSFIEEIPDSLIHYSVDVPDFDEVVVVTGGENFSRASVTLTSDVGSADVPDDASDVEAPGTCSVDANWCDAGQPWGDGRCNTSDPDLTSWYWQAGWYYAALECGKIEEIPPEFAGTPVAPTAVPPTNTSTPTDMPTSIPPTVTSVPPTATATPIPPTATNTPLPPFEAMVVSCDIPSETFTVQYLNAPAGTVNIAMESVPQAATYGLAYSGTGTDTYTIPGTVHPFSNVHAQGSSGVLATTTLNYNGNVCD